VLGSFVWSELRGLDLSGKCPYCFTPLVVLQPFRLQCVECAIHHKRDVREEQHPYICGANKQ